MSVWLLHRSWQLWKRSNPATGTFAWVGAEEAEIIVSNDFRWKCSMIFWAHMLLLQEGDIVNLPAPRNFSKWDIDLSKDTPIFATSDAPIVYIKGGSVCHANTEMMNLRWRLFFPLLETNFTSLTTPVNFLRSLLFKTDFR